MTEDPTTREAGEGRENRWRVCWQNKYTGTQEYSPTLHTEQTAQSLAERKNALSKLYRFWIEEVPPSPSPGEAQG